MPKTIEKYFAQIQNQTDLLELETGHEPIQDPPWWHHIRARYLLSGVWTLRISGSFLELELYHISNFEDEWFLWKLKFFTFSLMARFQCRISESVRPTSSRTRNWPWTPWTPVGPRCLPSLCHFEFDTVPNIENCNRRDIAAPLCFPFSRLIHPFGPSQTYGDFSSHWSAGQ